MDCQKVYRPPLLLLWWTRRNTIVAFPDNLSDEEISNIVEIYVVNPLAQVLIKESWNPGDIVTIEGIPHEFGEIFNYLFRRK